jgi:hypothetical protein
LLLSYFLRTLLLSYFLRTLLLSYFLPFTSLDLNGFLKMAPILKFQLKGHADDGQDTRHYRWHRSGGSPDGQDDPDIP